MTTHAEDNARYWDAISDAYQAETTISTNDFHYGPLLPGDARLSLLPEVLQGKRCLEVGCGAGQNSIFLAGQGAVCVALDISERQIEHGRRLAAQEGVKITFHVAGFDGIDSMDLGEFDIVHSTYALPFAEDPAALIRACRGLVRPDGLFLLTTSHPLYAGEWLELGPDEKGLLLPDYFCPLPDSRPPEGGHNGAVATYYPVSTVFRWLRESSFRVDRFLEPEPLPVPTMSDEEIQCRVPYFSQEWRALHPVLSCVPTVAIFQCAPTGDAR